ncbi:hypothetical protein [Streptomyces sp. NBC_00046]
MSGAVDGNALDRPAGGATWAIRDEPERALALPGITNKRKIQEI